MMQEFVQAIDDSIKKGVRGIHTAMPGVILSYDAGKGLATVQPTMKFKKPDGDTVDYAQITGVPVVFQQGMNQEATGAFPVKPGDGCLIIIAEQSIDYWLYGQETETDLAFVLTNAICIPGLFAKAIVHPNKTAEQEPLPAQSNQIQGGADAPKEDTDHA